MFGDLSIDEQLFVKNFTKPRRRPQIATEKFGSLMMTPMTGRRRLNML
jgi:hypothetical protein